MTTLRALIIEDNPPDAVLIRTAIGRAGFETEHVTTGEQAVKAVEGSEYHLILVDLCLPDISGNDLILALRGMESGGRSKIIAHTAQDTKEAIDSALFHGADDVFLKSQHRVNLLESRFRGLAHKMRREEQMHQRLGRVESDIVEMKDCLHKVAASVASMPEIAAAWDSTRGFVRVVGYVGTFVDKSKWLWGPAIVLFAWVKGGAIWPDSK